MSKKLVIVESPAKAKTIAGYLGKDFTVKASFGHVRDLPKSKLGIDVDHDFKIDYQPIVRAKKILAELKKDVAAADELYLAPDPDREGEAIAWHLVEALKPKIPVHRISFTEITKAAVQDAAAHPRQLDHNLIDAQQARRALDRLVGYKLSPLLWKKVYRGLSAGRVQSVAVRLVVEREREIKAFVPREYWTLEALLKAAAGEFKAYLAKPNSSAQLELTSGAEVDKILKQLKNADFNVADIAETTSTLRPSPPLITSTLQQMASRVLGFSAKRTMKIAQDLYEGLPVEGRAASGLITYMRTDSYNLSNTAKAQARDEIVKNYGARYQPAVPNTFTKKVRGAQEAHEAVRPTDFSLTPEIATKSLERDHARLYTLIWQAAMASQMTPAEVKNTVVRVGSSANIDLIARGRELTFDGFLKVYPDSEERFVKLPKMAQGEKITVKKLESEQHFTEPPARYSEATLVKELEKRGIGRPSTYAPIMSTIVDRGYVTKQTGRFVPEDVAGVVTDLLVENFPAIIDYDFTAKMEDELDDIADGDKKLVPVLKEFYGPFAALLKEKETSLEKKNVVEETDKICPKCGKPLVLKLGRFGKFYACSGFPDCKHTEPFLGKPGEAQEQEISPVIAEMLKEKCPDCGGELIAKQSRFGTFIGCSNYPKCKYTKSVEVSSGVKCPNCDKGELVKKRSKRGKIFWGCNNYPACKTAFWDEPVVEKCPNCGHLLLKKKDGLKCSNCDFTKDAAEPLVAKVE